MKTFRLFSMAAVALLMAACSNSDDFDVQKPAETAGVFHFEATIAAPNADASTRTVYTENGTTINVKWKVGDKIALVHNGVVDEAEVKTVDDVTGKATIEADINGSPSDDDDVYLAYPADAVVSATPTYPPFPFTPNPDIFDKVRYYQEGTLEFIQNNLDLRMGSGKLAVSGSDVSLKGSVSVPSLICIWKLTLQDESSNALSATKLTFKNNTDTQAKATMSTGKSEYYLCVVPSFIPDPSGTFSFEATVGSDTYTYSKSGVSLAAGKFYQSTVTMEKQASVPEGAISGVFSVSATKKVNFSKGNLRYASGTWSFFDNQYDYYTSYSADAWDKFGWSTSATTYGMNTSQNSSDYSGEFVDWGATMGTGWFTLSSAEWKYLFKSRTNAASKYGYATVAGKVGIIIVPDDFTDPMKNNGSGAFVGSTTTGWTANVYSAENWSAMETSGCVFLPAAGRREGSSVSNSGSVGGYWSATPAGYFAYRVDFASFILNPETSSLDRTYGCSVRLVREVPAGSQGTVANDRSYGDRSDLGTW